LQFSLKLAEIAERSQKLFGQWLEHQVTDSVSSQADPMNIGRACLERRTRMMTDPAKSMQAQATPWQSA